MREREEKKKKEEEEEEKIDAEQVFSRFLVLVVENRCLKVAKTRH